MKKQGRAGKKSEPVSVDVHRFIVHSEDSANWYVVRVLPDDQVMVTITRDKTDVPVLLGRKTPEGFEERAALTTNERERREARSVAAQVCAPPKQG